jgi:hypothetical protein
MKENSEPFRLGLIGSGGSGSTAQQHIPLVKGVTLERLHVVFELGDGTLSERNLPRSPDPRDCRAKRHSEVARAVPVMPAGVTAKFIRQINPRGKWDGSRSLWGSNQHVLSRIRELKLELPPIVARKGIVKISSAAQTELVSMEKTHATGQI